MCQKHTIYVQWLVNKGDTTNCLTKMNKQPAGIIQQHTIS